jgi:hypothetical protein
LAFGVWRLAAQWCSQDIGNSFELTPAALLLGFEQPKLYERFAPLNAER